MSENKHKEEVTGEESFWLGVLRFNKRTPVLAITKTVNLGRFQIQWVWKSKKNLWGRFGGGWNWKLGLQWGRTVIIINLFTSTLTMRLSPKSKPKT